MSDLSGSLAALAEGLDGVVAALVIEATGIEVETWGDVDFEAAAAEWADLWKQARNTESLAPAGRVDAFQLNTSVGCWVAVPLGQDYVLTLLAAPELPPGKARFYAREWALRHSEVFT